MDAPSISFDAVVLDSFPRLMDDSYRLRYQVYCIEREFLAASAYPQKLEIDDFDRDSLHVGAVDREGQLAGTARLILPIGDALPTMHRCAFAPIARPLWGPSRRWVEASRLSVSRSYRAPGSDERNSDHRGPIFLTVLRALYLASKEVDATHWLVSIERSLQRLLARHGFPFRQVGPVFDYLGPVAPYSLDLKELEQIVRSGRFPQLAAFSTAVRDYRRISDELSYHILPLPGPPQLPLEVPLGR
jgi:N-acyl amino acid synthase of PEP-CTERM/exosortase system